MMMIPYDELISAKMEMTDMLANPKVSKLSKWIHKIYWNMIVKSIKKVIYKSRDHDTTITKYELISFFEFVIETKWDNDIIQVGRLADRYTATFNHEDYTYIINTYGSTNSTFYFIVQTKEGEIRSEFKSIDSESPAGSCIYRMLTDYILDYLRIE